MGMNWENGLHGCEGCHEWEGESDELQLRVVPTQEYMGYEVAPTLMSVSYCPECAKKHDERVARALLESGERGKASCEKCGKPLSQVKVRSVYHQKKQLYYCEKCYWSYLDKE